MTAIHSSDSPQQSFVDSSDPHRDHSSRYASTSLSPRPAGAEAAGAPGFARRTLGICLLLIVVVLWTTSNFLASTIFADNTYSKPFFLTYINTSCFIIPLLPIIIKRFWALWRTGRIYQVTSLRTLLLHLDWHDSKEEGEGDVLYRGLDEEEGSDGEAGDSRRWSLRDPDAAPVPKERSGKLGLRATAKLSFEFCLLWFSANYFAMACLQYTTVGSTTILTSTSGVWTLIFGAVIGVEKVTIRKAFGVFASLVGIILISRIDLSSSEDPSSQADDSNGSFPHKSPGEIALGDAMAAFSAIIYGVYTIVMKKQVGDESHVNMQLFFGLVGLFNTFLLWPGFFILHFTGIETFALPGTSRIWTILLVNSVTSLISDICWAYAMLLTTPLVVTVGLSLTIPLSLVGQIILQDQYAKPLYWVGAVIVFLSFLIVNHESAVQTPTDAPLADTAYTAVPGEDREELRQ